MLKNKTNYQFAGSCFLLVFVFLGYVVKFYPEWLRGFDTLITRFIRLPLPAANAFYRGVTKIGDPITIVALLAVFVGLFLLKKWRVEALWLLLGIGGISGVVAPLLKLAFQRVRPTLPHLVVETSFSFPSGHATTSMILWGTLIFLLPLRIKPKSLALTLQIALGCLIFLIGISRIYLGVHFPTDILGGYCLGLSWLLLTWPYVDKLRFQWRFTGKQK